MEGTQKIGSVISSPGYTGSTPRHPSPGEILEIHERRRREIAERFAAPRTIDFDARKKAAADSVALSRHRILELQSDLHEATQPLVRLREAREVAGSALAASEAALRDFDEADRRAIVNWSRTESASHPDLRLDERRALERAIDDAKRHIEHIDTAISDVQAVAVPIEDEMRRVANERDIRLVNFLYASAEVLGKTLQRSVEEIGAIYADLLGLNQALANFKGVASAQTLSPSFGPVDPPGITSSTFASPIRVAGPHFRLRSLIDGVPQSPITSAQVDAAHGRWETTVRALIAGDDVVEQSPKPSREVTREPGDVRQVTNGAQDVGRVSGLIGRLVKRGAR